MFGEGDGIFQRFNNSLFDTNGYRAIGGVGWDEPKSLFRGEIYGGYQAQFQENLNGADIPPGLGIPPTTITKPVFGGRFLIIQLRTGRSLPRSTRHWGFRHFYPLAFRQELPRW